MNEQAQKALGKHGWLENGTWGGNHIGLKVTSDGAQLEFDCAHATIAQRFIIDDKGRFDVVGEYIRERGGPLRDGEKPDAHPARFFGEVRGRTMMLTVKLTDTGATIPTFTLVWGVEPRINKCL